MLRLSAITLGGGAGRGSPQAGRKAFHHRPPPAAAGAVAPAALPYARWSVAPAAACSPASRSSSAIASSSAVANPLACDPSAIQDVLLTSGHHVATAPLSHR